MNALRENCIERPGTITTLYKRGMDWFKRPVVNRATSYANLEKFSNSNDKCISWAARLEVRVRINQGVMKLNDAKKLSPSLILDVVGEWLDMKNSSNIDPEVYQLFIPRAYALLQLAYHNTDAQRHIRPETTRDVDRKLNLLKQSLKDVMEKEAIKPLICGSEDHKEATAKALSRNIKVQMIRELLYFDLAEEAIMLTKAEPYGEISASIGSETVGYVAYKASKDIISYLLKHERHKEALTFIKDHMPSDKFGDFRNINLTSVFDHSCLVGDRDASLEALSLMGNERDNEYIRHAQKAMRIWFGMEVEDNLNAQAQI
jgi:hypothetical protein